MSETIHGGDKVRVTVEGTGLVNAPGIVVDMTVNEDEYRVMLEDGYKSWFKRHEVVADDTPAPLPDELAKLREEVDTLNIELMNLGDLQKITAKERDDFKKWNDECVEYGVSLLKENTALKAENEKLRAERDEQRVEIISLSEARQVTPMESAERKEIAKRVIAKVNAEKAEFAALVARVRELAAALEPFAELAQAALKMLPEYSLPEYTWYQSNDVRITVCHLRTAADALKGKAP